MMNCTFLFSIKQPLIVFNVMSQNDITKIDNHWKAKQMLPRPVWNIADLNDRSEKKVSYILPLNLYCD